MMRQYTASGCCILGLWGLVVCAACAAHIRGTLQENLQKGVIKCVEPVETPAEKLNAAWEPPVGARCGQFNCSWRLQSLTRHPCCVRFLCFSSQSNHMLGSQSTRSYFVVPGSAPLRPKQKHFGVQPLSVVHFFLSVS